MRGAFPPYAKKATSLQSNYILKMVRYQITQSAHIFLMQVCCLIPKII